MPQYTIMAYNVEHMKRLFRKGKLDPKQRERAEAVAQVIRRDEPHVVGIVEAVDKLERHELFLRETGLDELGYRIAKSELNRGKQDLVVYYREPFELVSIDENEQFYEPWLEDIDEDGIKELCEFERKPLEVELSVRGASEPLLLVLVLLKSKGVFSVNDFQGHQHLALANRKRLHAQSLKLRRRLDELLIDRSDRSVLVMGDMNDEPGMDHFQRMVGADAIETIMGSVFAPERIFHNALWHLRDSDRRPGIWTTEYPDLIVANRANHRAWLDHIFVSPGMLRPDAPLRYVPDSGSVSERDELARKASDHFPITCRIEV